MGGEVYIIFYCMGEGREGKVRKGSWRSDPLLLGPLSH